MPVSVGVATRERAGEDGGKERAKAEEAGGVDMRLVNARRWRRY